MRKRFILLLMVISIFSCSCNKSPLGGQPAKDPVSIFDEAWKIIDERYALFEVKGIDWDSAYNIYRNQITAGMTEGELFRVLNHLLEVLKDGHVTLSNTQGSSSYDGFYTAFPRNFDFSNLVSNYLKNDYEAIGPTLFKSQNSVGYLYIRSFAEPLTDDNLNVIFNKTLKLKGLIIDVRDNTGGDSKNAERVFARLAEAQQLVRYEKFKSGVSHDDFNEPRPFFVTPVQPSFTKSIALLTNRVCFSACNEFAVYCSYLPNIKLVGDNTGGGGSIPFEYVLANGWRLRYSATVTLSKDKIPTENGVIPDISVTNTSIDESNGKDLILERAFQLLQ